MILKMVHPIGSMNHKPFEALCSYLPLPPIWEAERILGSMLGFKMGEKIEVISKRRLPYYSGEIYLRILLCYWKLYQGDKEVLNNDCEDDLIYENVLAHLHGQQIVKIEADEIKHFIKFSFSHGWVLVIEANTEVYDKEDVLFTLHYRERSAVSYSFYRGFYFYD